MIRVRFFLAACGLFGVSVVSAQNNSPYTRYGLGDVMPNTNTVNRGMGGVSAAYADPLSVNFVNPAAYSAFMSKTEGADKKVAFGRVLLDGGINIENRTLREPNRPDKFTSSDLYFSYLSVGIPIRPKWGLSFGIKPLTRISYQVEDNSSDSIRTEYNGNGGLFLPSIGTGYAIGNFSIGLNFGYIFGRREKVENREFNNDTVAHYPATYQRKTSFGKTFFNAGIQYKINLNKTTALRLGASGNLRTELDATEHRFAGTYVSDPTGRLVDTILNEKDIKGQVTYPASYTFGFLVDRPVQLKKSAWSFGVDFTSTKWSKFRNYGAQDAVDDSWQVRMGGQFQGVPGDAYFSNVTYRAGFFAGKDYITAGGEMNNWGITAGLGLPVINYNRLSPNQFTIINLALEYNKRGGNENILKDDVFRLSVGLNFSDLWFSKRKYD